MIISFIFFIFGGIESSAPFSSSSIDAEFKKPPSLCHGRYFRLSCPITERKNNSRNYYLMIDHTRSIIYLFIDLISFIFFSFEILFLKKKFFGLFRLKVSSSLFELRKEYGLSKDFLQNNGVMCEMMSFQISSK